MNGCETWSLTLWDEYRLRMRREVFTAVKIRVLLCYDTV